MKIFFISIGIVSLGLIAVAFYLAHSATSETLHTSRGTINYYFLFSRFIKNFPILNSIDNPVYYSSTGDGATPPIKKLTYVTSGEIQEISGVIRIYLDQNNCTPEGLETTLPLDVVLYLDREPRTTLLLEPEQDNSIRIELAEIY